MLWKEFKYRRYGIGIVGLLLISLSATVWDDNSSLLCRAEEDISAVEADNVGGVDGDGPMNDGSEPEETVEEEASAPELVGGLFQKQPYVVKLTDKNFEHETQASTGQTTGSWLVFLYHPVHEPGEMVYHLDEDSRPDDERSGEVDGYDGYGIPDESVWSEHHIVPAAVNIRYGRETWDRFKTDEVGDDHLPLFLFIHKGSYYTYTKSMTHDGKYTWKELLNFCLHYAEQLQEGKSIPSPKSPMNDFTQAVVQMLTEGGSLLRAAILVFGVLAFAAVSKSWALGGLETPKDKES